MRPIIGSKTSFLVLRGLSRKKIRAVWIGICLLPLLSGCQTASVRLEKQRIPEALLVPCEIPYGARTYGEAIILAERRGLALTECNKRLEDIRRWSAQ